MATQSRSHPKSEATAATAGRLSERKEEELMKRLLAEPAYADVVSRIERASTGRLYLIGRFLYQNLSHMLIGGPTMEGDLDFCVDGKVDRREIARLFDRVEQNRRYEALMLTQGTLKADLFELAAYDDARSNGSPPSLEKYLRGVPFTVQAIAYDIAGDRIIDDGALNAILRGEIAINNRAKYLSDEPRYRRHAHTKARQLGFRLSLRE